MGSSIFTFIFFSDTKIFLKCKIITYRSSEGGRDQATVDRDEAATDERLRTQKKKFTQGQPSTNQDLLLPPLTHLNELLLGAEVRHQNVLPVGHAGQGHAQPPRCSHVCVRGQVPVQAGPQHFHQVEGGVQRAQVPLPGLLCHRDHILTALC